MLIETPYGRKTPELLCRAMDCLVAAEQLMPLLDKAGVLNLYIAPEGSHHRTLCSEQQVAISDLFERLCKLTKEIPNELA